MTPKPGASAWSALTCTHPAATGVTTVIPAAALVTPPDETASIKVAWSGGKVFDTGKASVPQVSPLRPSDGGWPRQHHRRHRPRPGPRPPA
ncbi:DUF4232 domain-containing protein [Streptomyces sp. YKOK-I1]